MLVGELEVRGVADRSSRPGGAMPKGDETPSRGFPSFVGYPIRGSLSVSHTHGKQASSVIPSIVFV